MSEEFQRTEMLLGADGMRKLAASRVAVFGIGGVGGYAAEALVRSGIGAIDLIDADKVGVSNLNRQIIALHSTVGQPKVEAAAARFRDINPALVVRCHSTFVLAETVSEFDFSAYDYVVDAIDTVSGKLCLIQQAMASGTPIISAMGTGNKLDPTKLVITDISRTSMCPLARIMRKELRKRGIDHLKVLFSTEEPLPAAALTDEEHPGRRSIPGSTAFVPPAGGLIIASQVVRDLINAI